MKAVTSTVPQSTTWWEAVAVQARIFRGLEKLETLRKTLPAFSSQADVWTFDTGSDQVLGIGRYYRGQLLLGVFHFGDGAHRLEKPEGEIRDLITGEVCAGPLTVGPQGYLWLRVEA